MEYYSDTNKNEIMSFAETDGTGDHHVRKTEPD
jgi:hypothetical protein